MGPITCLVGVMLLVSTPQFLRASGEAITTAAHPSDSISPELKQDMEGILRQADLQVKSRIMLHLRFDYCEKGWSPTEGKFITPPQDSAGEATLDVLNRKVRFRTEYKPIVERWENGSQPFLIKNETEITDGEHTWPSSYARDGAADLGYLLGYRYRADSEVQFAMLVCLKSIKSVDAPLYTVQRTSLKGLTVIRVEESMVSGGRTQRRTWWFDPRRDYALIQSEETFFKGNSSQPSLDLLIIVEDLQELMPGMWYPTQFTTENSSYKDGKLEYSSFQATIRLTNLTLLSKVDDRLFQP
jgi:hypothetical protein